MLSQQAEEGTEKPVAFSSRLLSLAEQKYAKLEKEALAIIFGVKKFDQYPLGRKLKIYSDQNHCNTSFPNLVLSQQWHQQESRDGL